MELSELYEMQKALDARIIKEKGLEGIDLLPNTVLALQVEICELANEWRGFKHWSNDRAPRIKVDNGVCFSCGATGDENHHTGYAPFSPCPDCEGTGRDFKNILLEEYVDCLHFFLSIARQLDLRADALYAVEDVLEYETAIVFSELLHNVGLIDGHHFLLNQPEDIPKWQREHLRASLYIFYALGEQRLGFSFEEICEAYVAKNKVNHNRQSNGY